MIVATAGHIDHGKTRLVKVLTGIDTDRLPQERARGISIDLGFAHAGPVSFIDVPGHEKFIRNMLAGVCGIDASLLVVAADDGVMPQTLEHLHILDLLDVRRGAAVVTKTDVVTPERVAAVAAQVRHTLAGTSLAAVPLFPVSAHTGEGVAALRAWLDEQAAGTTVHEDPGHRFRLPVDRAFTVAGSGTVVTGTVASGSVSVGDQLLVSPSGKAARVRGVQVQGRPAERAGVAQRCALNLSGVSVEDVARGDWVLHPEAHAPVDRIDARLKLLAGEGHALAHWTPVHLHLGTADVPARIAVSSEGAVAPGTSSLVQLVLDAPIAALHGDRFVVRDQSARRTLGGGVVLDPFAPRRKRRAGLRHAELEAMERRTPAQILTGLLEISEAGVDLEAVSRTLNLTPERASVLQREAQAVPLGRDRPVAISRAAAELLAARTLAGLRDYHVADPRSSGMEIAALRRMVAPRLPAAAFQAFVRELANRQAIVLSNDLARLRGHEATANEEDERLWQRVQKMLAQAGVHAPLLAELAASLDVKESVLRDFLHRKSRTGEVMRVTADRFCRRELLARLAATAAEVAKATPDGYFGAARFRDAIGTGRGLAIHYLEFFDRLGITQRFGDRRRMGKDFASQLGAAEPLPQPEQSKDAS